MTATQKITRKALLSVQPGEYVERLEERRLRGPRGGQYVVGGEPVKARLIERKPSGSGWTFRFDAPLPNTVTPLLQVPAWGRFLVAVVREA